MAKPIPKLSPEEIKRVVNAAWEALPPYEAIQMEFGLRPGEITQLMKRELSPTAHKQWAARVKGAKAPTVKAKWPHGR
jgi:uncharacterized protein (TIGR03643 family)